MVEWGSSSDPFTVELTPTQLRRYIAYPLSGAGAVTAFLSLQLNWQVVRLSSDFDFFPGLTEELEFGVTDLPVWGTGWIVGVLVLAICTVLTYVGEPAARRHTRSVGLATAAVVAGLLVAVAVSLSRTDLLRSGFFGEPIDLEHELGPGVWLAFGTVVLIGAALWLAAPARARAPDGASADAGPAGPPTVALTLPWWPGRGRGWRRRQRSPADADDNGPVDLTVTPAEPFTRDDGA